MTDTNEIIELDEILSAFEVILYAMKWQQKENNGENLFAAGHIIKEYEAVLKRLKTWRINSAVCPDE